MKRLIGTLAYLLIITSVFAQSPEKMSYQSVVRDTKGNLAKNTTIGIQISILQGDINGALVYAETQLPVTNANGLATLVIGEGKTVSGSISSIDWSNGPYFIKTETDPSGGTDYTITGTSQLLSVPFALHATTAESLTSPVEESDPVFSSWDKSTGITISESQITDLKHFTNADETDPGYTADSSFIKTGVQSWDSSLAKTISTEDTARWGKAEADPLFSSWDKSTGVAIFESQITDLKHFTTADETDPVYGKSVAKGISKTDTARWNNKSGFSGNYADLSNKPTNVSSFANDAGYQKATDDGDTDPTNEIQYIYRTGNKIGIRDGGWVSVAEAESDPLFSASQAANITSSEMAHIKNLSGVNTGDQDLSSLATKTALSDSAAQLRSEIPDVSGFLSTETDPIYTSSQAANITVTDITNLGNLSGINTGNQDLSGLATKTALGDSAAQVRSEIPDVSGFLSTETDPTFTSSQAANITATDITNLGNLSGINTGNQDLSGLATKTALRDSVAQVRSEIPDVSGLATTTALNTGLDGKVDKVSGKGLSTEDYTTAEQTKLAGIEEGAQVNINADWNATSGDAQILNKPTIPSVADGSETKVTAGTNVTVTGAGTTASPYVVNAIASLTQVQRDALTATEGMVVYNTTTHKPNYYNGTEWMNYDGTSANVFAIGNSYQGGIIAYILQDVDPGFISGEIHGIIAAPTDQSENMPWTDTNDFTFPTTGATGTALGTGRANTIAIISYQLTGDYAARLCNNLLLGGYSWHLPSKDELNKLYLNKTAIGGFANGNYWSSTENDSYTAWMQSFDNGYQYNLDKDQSGRVRAVRAF